MGSSTGDLSYEADSAKQKNLLANRKRDRELTAQAYSSDLKGARYKKPLSGLAGAEMRRNQRLEPLVNGNKKISRITIARQDKSYDSKLEQINESNINPNRKQKPSSASMNKQHMASAGASTNYTR